MNVNVIKPKQEIKLDSFNLQIVEKIWLTLMFLHEKVTYNLSLLTLVLDQYELPLVTSIIFVFLFQFGSFKTRYELLITLM